MGIVGTFCANLAPNPPRSAAHTCMQRCALCVCVQHASYMMYARVSCVGLYKTSTACRKSLFALADFFPVAAEYQDGMGLSVHKLLSALNKPRPHLYPPPPPNFASATTMIDRWGGPIIIIYIICMCSSHKHSCSLLPVPLFLQYRC